MQPTCDPSPSPAEFLFGQQAEGQEDAESLLELPERFLLLADVEPVVVGVDLDEDAAPVAAADVEAAVRRALGQSPDLAEQSVQELHVRRLGFK